MAAHVYWANGERTNVIGRANLDGTGANQSFIPLTPSSSPPPGANRANAVAVDAAHVYWTQRPTMIEPDGR